MLASRIKTAISGPGKPTIPTIEMVRAWGLIGMASARRQLHSPGVQSNDRTSRCFSPNDAGVGDGPGKAALAPTGEVVEYELKTDGVLTEIAKHLSDTVGLLRQIADAITSKGIGTHTDGVPTAEGRDPVPPDCLSHEDAARFLGIPPRSLAHLVKSRKIRYVQIGDQRGRVFRIEDLRSYAAENTVRTAREMLARRGRRSSS